MAAHARAVGTLVSKVLPTTRSGIILIPAALTAMPVRLLIARTENKLYSLKSTNMEQEKKEENPQNEELVMTDCQQTSIWY